MTFLAYKPVDNSVKPSYLAIKKRYSLSPIVHIRYNWHMTTGLLCSICGQPNTTQVTTSGTYCVTCYGKYTRS
jgi:hypothetical protein